MKNPISHTAVTVGDVFLIQDDMMNTFLCKLAEIQRAIPDKDNDIRSYEIKTANGH